MRKRSERELRKAEHGSKSWFFLFRPLTFFLLAAGGFVLGIIGALGWIKLDETGMFVRWHLLDGPQSFQHLIYAHQAEVVAQADNEKFYRYRSDCIDSTDTSCDTWIETQQVPEFDSFTKRIVASGCEPAYEYYTKDTDYLYLAKPISARYPPLHGAKPKECFVKLELHPDGGETLTYYVLLDNGNVWKWIHKSIAMLYFLTVLRFAVVGLIIGIIIWFRFQKF